MRRRFFTVTRDLHLYVGLFLSPFVILFAISVFVLVRPSATDAGRSRVRHVQELSIPAGIENLTGGPRVDAVRPLLDQSAVHGEIGYIQYVPKDRRIRIPVSVPGRETSVDLNLDTRSVIIEERDTGVLDAFVLLHKSPGPHLVEIRMNWIAMRAWRWLADATAYLVLFLSVSGIYLWLALRSQRLVGAVLLIAGAVSFGGIVCALVAG